MRTVQKYERTYYSIDSNLKGRLVDLSNPLRSLIPSLEGEVYRILTRSTAPLTGARIATLADRGSEPGIRRALARLVEHGTVAATPIGSAILYSANRSHLLWPTIETAVREAEQTPLRLRSRIAEVAQRHRDPTREHDATVAIFGSVARASSRVDSDIDIAVVCPDPDLTEADQSLIDDLAADVAAWTGNVCNVYSLTVERLRELVEEDDPILGSWRADAVTVFGRDLNELVGQSAQPRS